MVVTTEQRSKTTFRPDVQVEPSEEVLDNSESTTSVDTRKVERMFAVRSVTEFVVDDGQQADKGRKTRLNDVDGLIRCKRSAGRIERLLRSKRSFGQLSNQKGECVIHCDKQLCSFPTLCEQELGQSREMDRGEIEVEEERRARANRMPVPPQTKRNMKAKARTWRVVGSARQKIPAGIWRLSRCHEWLWTVGSSFVVRTRIWSRIQC